MVDCARARSNGRTICACTVESHKIRDPGSVFFAPTNPGSLTERGAEVLRLISAGKTNLEIEDALVIPAGTSRRHVANIYEKIGAANRVEAASTPASTGCSSKAYCQC